MRFIMKLFKVLIIITLIMLLGYVIEERETIFMRSDNKVPMLNEHTSEEQEEVKKNPVLSNSENNQATQETTPNIEVEENGLIQSNKDDETESIEVKFNYQMEPIDKHSIGHLHEIQQIIVDYKLSPNDNYKKLYSDIYTKNFMHLEEELEEKNKLLYGHLIDLIESLNEDQSSSIIMILDEIHFILENIINLE